jgi:hypothetical protein
MAGWSKVVTHGCPVFASEMVPGWFRIRYVQSRIGSVKSGVRSEMKVSILSFRIILVWVRPVIKSNLHLLLRKRGKIKVTIVL